MWWQPLAAWMVWLVMACADASLIVRRKPAVSLSVGAFLASGTAALMVAPMTLLTTVAELMIGAMLLTMTAAATMIAAAAMIAAALLAMASSGFRQRHWLHQLQKMVKSVARYGAHHWTPTLAMVLLQ